MAAPKLPTDGLVKSATADIVPVGKWGDRDLVPWAHTELSKVTAALERVNGIKRSDDNDAGLDFLHNVLEKTQPQTDTELDKDNASTSPVDESQEDVHSPSIPKP